MLQPPGSSSNRSKPYAANRRKTQESPDDLVRQLQRNPPNRKCADCTSKHPQCVNLTMGTFVCISCAGIHRELNNRVKGIGHSSFTQEEVDRLKATDNDQVNAVWLARYNPSDRMKQPQDNQDQQHLRAWIRRKYQDKAWYATGNTPAPSPAPKGTKGQPPPQRPGQPQPTMVSMPPPSQDLLGSLGGGAPAPAAKNESWDAFGQSNQAANDPFAQAPPTQQNFANFGPPPNQPNDPFAAPPQQNFANFGQSPPRPPPPQQQQQQQQQQDPFATSQQQNFANLGQSPPPKPQQQQDPFAAQQSQNFASFGQNNPHQPQQQQQQDPFATPQQQNFANFGAPPQQQQQQQQFASFNQQSQNGAPQQFGNFGNMSLQQGQGPQMMPQPPPAQQMPQMGTMQPQQQQQGFASFNQMQVQQQQPSVPPSSQQQPQMGGMQPQQQGFAAFDQMQPPQQQQPSAPAPATSQQHPQMGGIQPQLQGFAAFNQMQPPQQQQPPPLPSSQQLPPMGSMSTQQQGFGATNQMPAQQQQQQTTGPSLNQQGQPVGNMQPQQQAFASFNQVQAQQQPNPAMTHNQQPQQMGGAQAPQQGFAAFNQMNTPQQGQTQGDGNATMNSAPPTAAPPQQTETLGTTTKKENPMDAFAHLSSDKSPVPSLSATTPPASMPPNPQNNGPSSRYVEDQKVCYRSNGDRCKAKVVKVHLDDALDPFYTIKLEFGKEKQTDDAHLEELNPLYEKMESVLLSLSGEQLAQVEKFISQLPNHKAVEGNKAGTPSMGLNGMSSAPNTGGIPTLMAPLGPMPSSNQVENNTGSVMPPTIPQLHSMPTPQQQQVQAQGQGAPHLQMRMQQPPPQPQGMPQQQFNPQMNQQQAQFPQMNMAPQQGMMSGLPQQQPGMVQPSPYGQTPGMMMMPQQTNNQPMGMPQQNPMNHQIQANATGQAPQVQPPMSPQGNPFDMY